MQQREQLVNLNEAVKTSLVSVKCGVTKYGYGIGSLEKPRHPSVKMYIY